ncbi:MAG: universal stress protein [Mesorhizobium sp.]|nr:universal stress protein [Mesorhizobium sp.]MBL8579185.1 universal stress protein [Mesorhizobium sp.]
MKLKTFLPLVTYPDPASETSIANAVAASKLLGAELNALALEVEIPQVSNPLSRALLDVGEMIKDARNLSAQRSDELLADVKTGAAAAGLPVRMDSLKSAPALLGEVAGERARHFDLALLGLEPDNAGTRMVAEGVIFGSGRPSLLLPTTAKLEKLDHIAIAWDGSRVAARAVADARLLLERASSVSIVTVTDEKPLKDKDSGERLAESLRDAGLKAEFNAIRAESGPIAATLQRYAAEKADLLVMGGYGHSRLRDFVLGGATEGVLSDLKLPVLLSH